MRARCASHISTDVPKFVPTTAAQFEELRSFYRYEKTPLAATITERVEDARLGSRDDRVQRRRRRARDRVRVPAETRNPARSGRSLPSRDRRRARRDGAAEQHGGHDRRERARRPCDVRRRACAAIRNAARQAARPSPRRTTAEFRDKIVNWVTDLRRGLDYLETRTDIDRERIAFVGQSSGARTGHHSGGGRAALSIRLLSWRRRGPGADDVGQGHEPYRLRSPHPAPDDDAAGPARRGDPAHD